MLVCRYFSGEPAPGLPQLQRPDGTTRPDFEARLLNGTDVQAQYYQQYVRPATQRAFKQMQVRASGILHSFQRMTLHTCMT